MNKICRNAITSTLIVLPLYSWAVDLTCSVRDAPVPNVPHTFTISRSYANGGVGCQAANINGTMTIENNSCSYSLKITSDSDLTSDQFNVSRVVTPLPGTYKEWAPSQFSMGMSGMKPNPWYGVKCNEYRDFHRTGPDTVSATLYSMIDCPLTNHIEATLSFNNDARGTVFTINAYGTHYTGSLEREVVVTFPAHERITATWTLNESPTFSPVGPGEDTPATYLGQGEGAELTLRATSPFVEGTLSALRQSPGEPAEPLDGTLQKSKHYYVVLRAGPSAQPGEYSATYQASLHCP